MGVTDLTMSEGHHVTKLNTLVSTGSSGTDIRLTTYLHLCKAGIDAVSGSSELSWGRQGKLANWVSQRIGPRSIKTGSMRLFRQEDLDLFIEEKLFETERFEKCRRRQRGRGALVLACPHPDLFLFSVMALALAAFLFTSVVSF